jgi:amino acid permease
MKECLFSRWYDSNFFDTKVAGAHAHQALASAGIIPGVLTCIFSGGTAAFGLYLLSRAAAKAPHRRSSFFAVAELTYPKAAVFFDAAIAIKCFGVSIR